MPRFIVWEKVETTEIYKHVIEAESRERARFEVEAGLSERDVAHDSFVNSSRVSDVEEV